MNDDLIPPRGMQVRSQDEWSSRSGLLGGMRVTGVDRQTGRGSYSSMVYDIGHRPCAHDATLVQNRHPIADTLNIVQ